MTRLLEKMVATIATGLIIVAIPANIAALIQVNSRLAALETALKIHMEVNRSSFETAKNH